MRDNLSDYAEDEFRNLMISVHIGTALDEEVEDLVAFLDTTKHPEGSAVLTHPQMCGIEDNPDAIIAELKRFYVEQGLPCFKDG